MTPTNIAIIFLRISGVSWLIEVVVALTTLPGDIFGVLALQPGYLATQREVALAMEIFRICLYLGIAIAFLVFPLSLAKLFTKGLDHVA